MNFPAAVSQSGTVRGRLELGTWVGAFRQDLGLFPCDLQQAGLITWLEKNIACLAIEKA
ncbi:hypothetical protein [Candidatus Methylacidithermus pantelleriae]|uniref:Uncharacterized protein n=1 Tax=Candidatus Methylacidithermus pantelleriae TaxID=2744239 RepID=A0A8J2BMY6_9BACT|nr:hypothetical protein [Candidatus Methylacidithermus pantelleriae]CAF0703621.1 hypothetical protein MPNT_60047 [Candidatus Methylacidithermus pantelleriae]